MRTVHRTPADPRPDWRDPNMHCECFGYPCSSESMNELASEIMADYDARPHIYADEHWYLDPTYHLRRPRP